MALNRGKYNRTVGCWALTRTSRRREERQQKCWHQMRALCLSEMVTIIDTIGHYDISN